MKLNANVDIPFDNLNKIGFAVCTEKSDGKFQFHVAIICNIDDQVKLFHLPTNSVVLSQPHPKYLWLDLGESFTDIDRNIILAHIRKIIDANGIPFGVSYGFDIDGKFFDPETGRFTSDSNFIGLTCATFILEVFLCCGFQLIETSTWPPPTSVDKKWQEAILSNFVNNNWMSKEVYIRQLRNVGNKRFYPQEVAASSQLDCPASRGDVLPLATQITSQVKAHFKTINAVS